MSDEPELTPSQLLMECLERFGACEPICAIVIYTDEAGNICWNSTTTSRSQQVGMLELTKLFIVDESRRRGEA